MPDFADCREAAEVGAGGGEGVGVVGGRTEGIGFAVGGRGTRWGSGFGDGEGLELLELVDFL